MKSKKKKGKGKGTRKENEKKETKNWNNSNSNSNNDEEEVTALSSIFQEDCKVTASLISIKVRPYLRDGDSSWEDKYVDLTVRCSAGYPSKAPRINISAAFLSDIDSLSLLSLLRDQALSNARDSRVMIFDLVEAAQEFLSSSSSSSYSSASASAPMPPSSSSSPPFIHASVDLFSASGDSSATISSSAKQNRVIDQFDLQKLFQHTTKPPPPHSSSSSSSSSSPTSLAEETETCDDKSKTSSDEEEEAFDFHDHGHDRDTHCSSSLPTSQTSDKDLILVATS